MKISTRLALLACLALAFSYAGLAQGRSLQDQGYWRPASNTARSITGDIAFADAKFTIDFNSYVMAQIRTVRPDEAGAAFDLDPGTGGNGNLYRTSIPATKHFLHHNTLCGSDQTQWIVTWVTGGGLQVAFFSGEKTPILTRDVLANSTSLCGTYTYMR